MPSRSQNKSKTEMCTERLLLLMYKPKEPYVTWYIPRSYYSLSLFSFDKFHFSSFFWDLMTPWNCLSLTLFTLHPLEFSKLWFNIFFCLSINLHQFVFLILAFFHLSVRNSSNLILETTMLFIENSSKVPFTRNTP